MGRYVTALDWMAIPTGHGRREYQAYVPHPLQDWAPLLDASAVLTVNEATQSIATISAAHDEFPHAALVDWVLGEC